MAAVTLMSDDLSSVPWLIRHSRHTRGIVGKDIAVSLAVKEVSVLLMFLGYVSLWAAIAADRGVSLAVVFNAFRLLNSRGA